MIENINVSMEMNTRNKKGYLNLMRDPSQWKSDLLKENIKNIPPRHWCLIELLIDTYKNEMEVKIFYRNDPSLRTNYQQKKKKKKRNPWSLCGVVTEDQY